MAWWVSITPEVVRGVESLRFKDLPADKILESMEHYLAHYGEVWYDLGGRRTMSRSTTAEGVLETIYSLADVTPVSDNGGDVFRGHPLAAPPRGAATIFYGIWPALAIASHRSRD